MGCQGVWKFCQLGNDFKFMIPIVTNLLHSAKSCQGSLSRDEFSLKPVLSVGSVILGFENGIVSIMTEPNAIVNVDPLSAEQLLKAIRLFQGCPSRVIDELATQVRMESYKKGETILFQGIISHQLYIVSSGSVSVYSRKDKTTRFLATLERGATFGEISLIKSCAATATVKASVDGTEIFSMDYEAIKVVLDRHPEVRQDLERQILERNQNRLEAFEKQKEPPLNRSSQPETQTASKIST